MVSLYDFHCFIGESSRGYGDLWPHFPSGMMEGGIFFRIVYGIGITTEKGAA